MKLDAIGVICSNIAESKKFYSNFNLDFTEFGEGHLEATNPTGLRLMLDSVDLIKSIDPDFKELQTGGVVICFAMDSANEVDSKMQDLKTQGVKLRQEPFDAFWGQRYASVMDPDGNQIHIFAELEPKE